MGAGLGGRLGCGVRRTGRVWGWVWGKGAEQVVGVGGRGQGWGFRSSRVERCVVPPRQTHLLELAVVVVVEADAELERLNKNVRYGRYGVRHVGETGGRATTEKK